MIVKTHIDTPLEWKPTESLLGKGQESHSHL